jgi:putative iron-regulated protein
MKLDKLSRNSAIASLPRIWSTKSLVVLLVGGLLVTSAGCANNSTSSNSAGDAEQTEAASQAGQFNDAQVVADFADQVVLPTYQLLVERAGTLSQAVDAFVNDPTDATLSAAQEAWLATRSPWEQSEAFAFGPAESLGYDGDLDDWPVNETDVQAVLESDDPLTPESVKSLQTTQKGFHTIELLLFGTDNNKQAADFSERELQYLQALTTAFNQTATDLQASWSEGVEGNPPYREVLATAGQGSSAYPTVQAGAEEIVQGMLGCLDEVANEKIGEPLETQETLGLESRFSHSSLADFQHNIQSVQNAYLGEVPDASSSGESLSSFVAEVNPDLDAQIKQELQAALEAIATVPGPIEETLPNPDAQTQLETAKEAILTLHSTIEEQVLPLVQG